MTSSITNSYTVEKQRLEALLDGLTNHLPAGVTSMIVEGRSTPIADIIAMLQSNVAILHAVDNAKRALKSAMIAREKLGEQHGEMHESLRIAIKGMLGKRNPDLAKFGERPARDPRALTAEEDVLRAERNRATRAARHTMGSRQRLAIKGVVEPQPANDTNASAPTGSSTLRHTGS